MYIREVIRSDFEIFRQVLRDMVPANDEVFENNVWYDEERIILDLTDLYNERLTLSKQYEVAHELSSLFDCVCAVTADLHDVYAHFRFEQGRVSMTTVDTESDEYGFYGDWQTEESDRLQKELVLKRLSTLKHTPMKLQQYMSTLQKHVPGVLPVIAGDLSTSPEVLMLLDGGEGTDPALRKAAETNVVRQHLAGQQWEALEAVLSDRDLDSQLLLEIVETTDRFDLSVLESGSVTPALVERIATRGKEETQLAVVEHLYASTNVLETLSQSDHPAVVQAAEVALRNQSAKLQEAADSGFLQDQVFAANDSSAPEALLLELSSSRFPAVKAAVVRNLRTPPDALRAISTTLPLPHLLLAVAAHPNTPTDLLEELSQSPVPSVHEKALSRLAAQD